MVIKIKNVVSKKYSLILGALVTIMCLGYFLTYLRFAKPRGFKGDFYAAMYDPNWWDGRGVIYGPIFVFERWIVNALPSLAKVELFAFGCLVLIATALITIIRIVHADRAFTLFCVSIWTFNTFFYYSFSVAANPELVELLLLVIMWWAISNKRYNLAWFVFTFAVLTKVVPIIMAPFLLLFFSWSGLVIGVLTTTAVLAVVSIGQKQSILSSISQMVGVNAVPPQPDSEQFLGLNSGLSRLFGLQSGENFSFVTSFALIIAFILYFLALLVLMLNHKFNLYFNHEVKVAYIFAVFMCLMPIFHLGQTHRHTYLFLAPVFIAFRFVVGHDTNLTRSKAFKVFIIILFLAYSLVPIYALDVYNFDSFSGYSFGNDFRTSLLMLTEPVWANILLFSTLLLYGIRVILPSRVKI